MKNLKVNECLFHGVRKNNKNTSIEVFEEILDSKFILTHDSLRQKGIVHEREAWSHQGSNAVSVCFHPQNQELFEQLKNVGIPLIHEDNAFTQFINVNAPSFVFHKDILNILKYRNFGGYKRMTDEIQILSDISLKYVIAIGYGNNKMNNSSTDYSFQLTNEWQSNLETIQKLLKKYNFQIPIINPVDGSVYENNKKLILK